MQDRVIHSKKIDWKQIQTLQPDKFKMPEQQEVLKKSLLANGFVSPFCVWQDEAGVIWSIDGVHRIKALTELQEQGQDIPELLTANFIEAKDRKEAGIILLEVFNTKQNKATEQGVELLKIDLNISNDDLHIGFEDLDIKIELEDQEVTELEATEALDEAPEPPTIPITVKGDLYELNEHRVLCGDSLLIDDVDKVMQGERADLLLTDLPYGVNYSSKNEVLNALDGGNRIQAPIANDNKQQEDLYAFFKDIYTAAYTIMHDCSSYYAFMPQGGDQMLMMQALTDSGFLVKHELMWLKNNHVLGRADYNYKHEPICYGWTSKGKHKFYATEFKTSVLEFDKPSSSKLHPTMKPLELLNELICNSTDKNMVVYDPTAGSGSTLIAAEQTNRKCYGIELEEKYCDVVVTRWVKMMQSNNKEYVVKRNGEVIDWDVE